MSLWGLDTGFAISLKTSWRFIRLVKQNFCAENYVELNLKKQIRSVITQLRAGCLPIEIELGRYQTIPRDQRLCKQCTQNHIENELHFIIYCPKFDQIRHDLLTGFNATCGSK